MLYLVRVRQREQLANCAVFTMIISKFCYSPRGSWIFHKSFPPETFYSPAGVILWTLGSFNVLILLSGWICLHGVLDYAGS